MTWSRPNTNNKINHIIENPAQIITPKNGSETEEARHIRNVTNGYRSIDWKPKQGSILVFHYTYQESVELVTFLGSGTYGEVWKGKEKSRKREVAVKIETKIASYSELYISIFILMTNVHFRIGTLFNMKSKFMRFFEMELESQKLFILVILKNCIHMGIF